MSHSWSIEKKAEPEPKVALAPVAPVAQWLQWLLAFTLILRWFFFTVLWLWPALAMGHVPKTIPKRLEKNPAWL
jgi:hypothetical protein